MPSLSWIDAATQAIAGFAYLVVALSTWRRAPGDARARVFLGLAIANVVTFGVPAAAWLAGITDVTALPRGVFLALFVAMSAGSVLLFHFCQVFPWRRPWIERHGRTLAAAYAVAPLATAALVVAAPATVADISYAYLAALVLAGLPLVILLTMVLPVGGIVSLVKSYRDARDPVDRPVRAPLAWLLVSQIAGGTIALVFAPVLATVAPGDAARMSLTLVSWALGLLTPIAFAVAMARLSGSGGAAATETRRA